MNNVNDPNWTVTSGSCKGDSNPTGSRHLVLLPLFLNLANDDYIKYTTEGNIIVGMMLQLDI